jgi:hypothetical protein
MQIVHSIIFCHNVKLQVFQSIDESLKVLVFISNEIAQHLLANNTQTYNNGEFSGEKHLFKLPHAKSIKISSFTPNHKLHLF